MHMGLNWSIRTCRWGKPLCMCVNTGLWSFIHVCWCIEGVCVCVCLCEGGCVHVFVPLGAAFQAKGRQGHDQSQLCIIFLRVCKCWA